MRFQAQEETYGMCASSDIIELANHFVQLVLSQAASDSDTWVIGHPLIPVCRHNEAGNKVRYNYGFYITYIIQ